MDDLDLITTSEACRVIGGETKPVHPSTVNRGVRAGRYSPPLHPSPGIARFDRATLLADILAGHATANGAGK